MVDQNLIYRMSKNPRGLCLIINYYDFSNYSEWNKEDQKRNGYDKDDDIFEDIFEELNFENKIISPSDLMKKDVLEILDDNIFRNDDYSKWKKGHKTNISKEKISQINHEAFVIIVSSHGTREGICCSNRSEVTFQQIINKINDYVVLKDKPKIILFNCCRRPLTQNCMYYL